jgi:hypothetical protein
LGDGQSGHRFPVFLPDGQHFLFYATGAANVAGIYLASLNASEPIRLMAADTAGVYLPPGWLLWAREGTLLAQRLPVNQRSLIGDELVISESVAVDPEALVAAVSASGTGLVAYRVGGARRQLTWFDRTGKALGTLGAPDDSISAPRVSPNGRRVVVVRTVQGNTDLWLLDGTRTTRFTSDPGRERFPVWSPDGIRIVFDSDRTGTRNLYIKTADGAGVEEREELLVESDQNKTALDWSVDGRFLLYQSIAQNQLRDLWVRPMATDGGAPWTFLKTSFDERYGRFSPDGQWVAYMSNESGRMQIHVRPFTAATKTETAPVLGAGQRQVSTEGGIFPLWRLDGRELYYIAPNGALMAVPMSLGTTAEPGTPTALFHTRIFGGFEDSVLGRQYEIARDGRFLINTVLEEGIAPITVLQNWRPGLPARENR